jgi:hypothetical protein
MLALVVALGAAGSTRRVEFGFYDTSLSRGDGAALQGSASLWNPGAHDWSKNATLSVANAVAVFGQTTLPSLLNLEALLFVGLGTSSAGLHPDYAARWSRYAAVAKPAVANGTVLGFDLGDELVYQCVDSTNVSTVADAVRREFPRGEAVIWYNDVAKWNWNFTDKCGVRREFFIPPALDWFSIDMYHMDGPVAGWVHDHVQLFYEHFIFPLLGPAQRVALVPGSFGSDVNHFPNGTYVCDRSCYVDMCTADARDFAAWASSDDRVAAVMPWNWGGCAMCNGSRWTPGHTCCMDEVGTRELPALRDLWLELGRNLTRAAEA